MAKTSNPDSATSEWFINYDDNSAALDNPNNSGGFTVFGEVVAGMNVVDAITNLTIQDSELWINPFRRIRFNELPVLESFDPLIDLNLDGKLVMVTRIPNVKSTSTELGTVPTYAADVDMVFDSVGTVSSDDALALVASFSSPQNQSVHFNNGIHSMKMSGVMGSAPRIVALYDGATARPNRYYAYGKTLDNPLYHWYDFTFDGETGAEFKSNRIILHFVDGKRGDDDLTVNDSITHTGAQTVVTSVDDGSAQGGGCSIAQIPPDVTRGGDWVVVSLFLTMLALVGRRTRRGQHQGSRSDEDTNIASP
jgi:hypothetical protein